ncbi:MAG: hypothetical protein VKP72_06170 [bacterium]|nr:hypothetical protein [bacterium]
MRQPRPLLLPAPARSWSVLSSRKRRRDFLPWVLAGVLFAGNVITYALTVQQEADNNHTQEAIVRQDQINVQLRAELSRSEALDHVEALASRSLALVPAAGTLFLPAPPAPSARPQVAPLPERAREAF